MKRLVSILMHRVTWAAGFFSLQLIVLLVMIGRFNDSFIYFYWVCILVSVVVVFWIVSAEINPAYKIAWIIPILVFPIFGGLLYLLFGGSRLSVRTRRKMECMANRTHDTLAPDLGVERLRPLGAAAVHQSRYLERMSGCPAYENTVTEYYSPADRWAPRLLKELSRAKRYIFLEYFIISEGRLWSDVVAILAEKARTGVDVRLIYDDLGCIFTLPPDFAAHLEELNIRCRPFNQLTPFLSLRLNNRSHRKVCIIDGHTAFTGGVNLADEYVNYIEKYGHWKDSVLGLRGDAVWSMTVAFLTMWDYITGQEDQLARYRPSPLPPAATAGASGFVQPYTDNPLDEEPVGETVYLNLINKARKYIYLTTPYLIIDDTMNTALRVAAKSGVDVRIITPHIPDKPTVLEVTRAHYDSLLKAGVRIYEYTPGFMHAKNAVVDDRFATVSTVNLDYRSLFLHFENGVWLCNTPTVSAIRDDFLNTLAVCQEITLSQARATPLWRTAYRTALRVLAPLL